jgi:hypothetical protein
LSESRESASRCAAALLSRLLDQAG